MRYKCLVILTGIVGIFLMSSCGVNSHIMFQGEGDEIITENIPLSPKEAYRISPDDKLTFTMFTENGKQIIDVMTGTGIDGQSNRLMTGGDFEYLVREDGTVEFPLIGLVNVEGLSIVECQELLSGKFATKYNDPFVLIEVTNRRVIVFPGSGGSAKVVPITNNNTTLMEAIALAGGITERGQSRKIKVIRRTDDGRKIYSIDLSTIAGIKYADMVVQSNDYIYVEPTKQLSKEVLKEVTPIISLISSAIVVVSVILSLN